MRLDYETLREGAGERDFSHRPAESDQRLEERDAIPAGQPGRRELRLPAYHEFDISSFVTTRKSNNLKFSNSYNSVLFFLNNNKVIS